MEALDSIAHRYGIEPALLIGETDPLKAFSINLWAHNWGVGREGQQRYIAGVEAKHGLGRSK